MEERALESSKSTRCSVRTWSTAIAYTKDYILKHSHNNHILWGQKDHVDFLCYSSGVRTHIQPQAMASVKNAMKGL